MNSATGLRELTPAERAYLDRVRGRGQKLALAFGAVMVVVGMVVFRGSWRDAAGQIDWVTVAVVLGFPAAFVVLFLVLTSRSPWRLPSGRYARVSRLRGRHYVAGKPTAWYIGDYPVAVPTGLYVPPNQVVDVEVCPCLEDYPKRAQARIVLSSADGRSTVDQLVRAGRWPRL